jgi:DNA-binding CsgD family transcriptional regulator
MVFFWSYFRFQVFFGNIYPLDLEVTIGGLSLQLYSVFLVILAIASASSLPFASRIEQALLTRPLLVPLVSAFGSLGVAVMLLVENGVIAPWFSLFSALLVAAGFLIGYYAWALFCSYSFSLRNTVLLAASYPASIVIFSFLAFFPAFTDVALLVIPLATGVAWHFSLLPKRAATTNVSSSLRSVNLFVCLFIAFILAGSVIRGILDLGVRGDSSYMFRLYVSIVVSVLVFLVSWAHGAWMRSSNGQKGKGGMAGYPGQADSQDAPIVTTRTYSLIERYTFFWWLILALLFFMGIFISLLPDRYSMGGHIVVVARSTLDFFLWMLLCGLVWHKRAQPIPFFIVYSLFIEIASWVLSYVVMPHAMQIETGTGLAIPEALAIVVAFLLLIVMATALAALSFRRRPTPSLPEEDTIEGVLTTQPENGFRLTAEQLATYHFTSREVEVVKLFAQGLSLKKVASILFISPSTAQTHIKSIYKKLGIHSKDELIELVKSWEPPA